MGPTKLAGRLVVQARMGAHLVVVHTPVLDNDLRLDPITKPFCCQTLVPELAVEAFVRAVLPWLARVD